MKWKIVFGVAGLFSLIYILHNYGFSKLSLDLQSLGWWSIPLALSFFPVLALYAMAWWLVTPKAPFKTIGDFIQLTVIGIAWNNLSPFVKVLGEPIKVSLLKKHVSPKEALESVILYNLVHTYGTIGAFVLGASIILWAYPVPSGFKTGFLVLIFTSITLMIALTQIPKLVRGNKKRSRNFLSKTSFWIRWSLIRINVFSKNYPQRFWLAVILEISARFVEGLTFYIAFYALNDPILVAQAALLDVGRAVLDNLFFFVPYQVGSREASVLFLAEKVLAAGHNTAVSAAVFYRLVEILWMGIGYILWIKMGSSRKLSK